MYLVRLVSLNVSQNMPCNRQTNRAEFKSEHNFWASSDLLTNLAAHRDSRIDV